MTYKKYCCNCNKNYTTNEKLLYFKCFNCKEKLPTGKSIKDNENLFSPYIYSLNNQKVASAIWLYSQAKFLWSCEYNHEFRQSPKNILDGAKCKKCLPGKIFKNSDSLLVKFSELSKEWDYEKNIFTPSDYTFGSTVKAWWSCSKCSHNWQASIRSRTNKMHSNGCPKCTELSYRSKGEIELLKFIESIYKGVIKTNVKNVISNRELDIYLPELNIAIEYNGDYWHSNSYIKNKYNKSSFEYHYEKYLKCLEENIELFFVWESDWINNETLIKTLVNNILNFENNGENNYFVRFNELNYLLLQRFE